MTAQVCPAEARGQRARTAPMTAFMVAGGGSAGGGGKNSGQRESNPHSQLGRLEFYH